MFIGSHSWQIKDLQIFFRLSSPLEYELHKCTLEAQSHGSRICVACNGERTEMVIGIKKTAEKRHNIIWYIRQLQIHQDCTSEWKYQVNPSCNVV